MTKKAFPGRYLWAGAVLVLPCLLFLPAGCSSSSKKATVSGTVTYKGQPVTGGTIELFAADGDAAGRSQIPIKADGSFSTSDVPPGLKKVAIETESIKKMAHGGYAPPANGPKPPNGADPKKFEVDTSEGPKYVKIPSKYADPKTSGLTWEITKGKQSPKTFDLTD